MQRHSGAAAPGTAPLAKRQRNLNLFIDLDGHHEAAWRYSGAEIGRLTGTGWFQGLAPQAERAAFDVLTAA